MAQKQNALTDEADTSSPADSANDGPHENGHGHKSKLWTLVLGSIGVVYGDIGTSPLYAFKESIAAAGGGHVTPEIIVGILSLIVWALVLVVSIKYVVVLMRADNNGEGGTLTLVALAQRALGRRNKYVLALGILGAALFYGDAVLTPAISVLSAVEGLKIAAPSFAEYVVPITVSILVLLFAVQRYGTARVGAFFGPIMVLWFLTLGGLGLYHMFDNPEVFSALNPMHAVMFFVNHSGVSLVVLGAICLSVTGAEALYSDLGHFGPKPIRFAWFGLIFPCLILNYFGQGAVVMSDPLAADQPLYRLAPDWGLVPLIILATSATIIASQSVITGAYSLTRQAIQLGLLPRLETRFTSETHQGQIYLPRVNKLLLVGVCVLVIMFKTSSDLAHAYGISVFGAMSVDAILAIVVIWKGWRWSLGMTLLLMVPFLLIDLAFLGANMTKLFTGGYVPVLMATGVVVVMWTWVRGTAILFEKTRKTDVPLAELVPLLQRKPPHRIKGTAVFLTSDPETSPAALLHNLKHNMVLHEKNVILTVKSADMPRVHQDDRVQIEEYADGFWRVLLIYGYMETPNIPKGLALLRKKGFKFDIMSTSFFLSRRSIKASPQSGMPLWQDHLYIGLAKTATDATNFFQIPTGRVVEIGTQVTV